MIDLEQFSSWVFVALFFAVAVFFAVHRPRQPVADRFEQLTEWAAKHGGHDPDFDDDPLEVAEMRETLRAEKLYADLDRLRHLVATDTYMSATRQLGNRLAYQQLRKELATLSQRRELVFASVGAGPTAYSGDVVISRDQRGPESLDVRWR